MKKRDNSFLFNFIAPIYDLFYKKQKKGFSKVLKDLETGLALSSFDTIIDIGCGTGALCSILNKKGFSVTGIDSAKKMVEVAMNKKENEDISFYHSNVLEILPFEDKSFDVSIASYVAHGLQAEERKLMYAEMNRITKHLVLIYDYNDNRSTFISIIEWLEGGDYFHFIKNAKPEMKGCVSEMKKCFSKVKVVKANARSAWYICKPIIE